MNCIRCQYKIDPKEDIFCQNCGVKLAEYEIFPAARHLTLFEKGEYRFTFKNKGVLPLFIMDCSYKKFTLTGDSEVKPGAEGEIRLSYDSLRAGDASFFKIITSADAPGKEPHFDYEIVKKPELNFAIKGAVFKNGTWHLPETKRKNLILELNSDHNLTLMQDVANLSDGLQKVILQTPKIGDSTNRFEFLITNTDNLAVGNTVELKAEFLFQGIKQVEDFRIDISQFATLKMDEQKSGHQCKIGKVYRPNILEVVQDAQLPGKLNLFYKVEKGKIRIDNLNFSPTIRRVSDDQPLVVRDLLTCTVDGGKTGREFNENEQAEFEITVNSQNAPAQLFADQTFPVAGEMFVYIRYTDLDKGFQSEESYPVTVKVFQREPITVTIDYGTTNSCIAFIDSNISPTTALLAKLPDHGELLTEFPSFMQFESFYDEKGLKYDLLNVKVDIGANPKNLVMGSGTSAASAAEIAFGFKSLLSKPDNYEIYFSDKNKRSNKYTPSQLVSIFLNELLKKFESRYPFKIDELHLTFPAAFSQNEKYKLKQAAMSLGFTADKVILEVAEPLGLAAHYAKEITGELSPGDEKIIAVFDCGGGTTDLTIARFSCDEDGDEALEFIASDGIFSSNREAAIGGNYLSFLIANKIKTDIESKESVILPFPVKFKLPIELEQGADKNNFNQIFEASEKIKTGQFKEYNLSNIEVAGGAITSSLDHDENAQYGLELAVRAKSYSNKFTEDDLVPAVGDDLAQALAKVNLMLYLTDIEANKAITKEQETEKIELVWARGAFIKFNMHKNDQVHPLSHVSGNFTDFDKVLEEFTKLYEKNKVSSFFIDRIFLIGFVQDDDTLFKQIKDNQEKAEIKFYNKVPDVLILGGNSSRLPYLQELAAKIIPARKIIKDVEWVKTGVATGACLLGQLNDHQRGFYVKQSHILPYAIGYLKGGKFSVLLEQWQTLGSKSTSKETKPYLISRRAADRTIPLYENRDIADPMPKLTPHNALLQPVIGRIEIPEQCIGQYVKFNLTYCAKKGVICYNLLAAASLDDDFEVIREMEPI